MTTPGPDHRDRRAGRRVGGYEIETELGRGGQAIVYRARPADGGPPVALKLVPRALMSVEGVTRLKREFEVARGIDHPHVARVIEVGEDREGWYLVEELLPGGSLTDRIDAWRRADHLPVDHYRHVAELIAKIADALQAAHDAGFVHRDVSPGNVLFDADGEPRLIDFGVVRGDGLTTITQSNSLLGSPSYTSPEQVMASPRGVDARSDVYSLGAVMYEALTLERPFEGDARQVLARIVMADLEPAHKRVGTVPEPLSVVCGKAMEKAPTERYENAGAFADDLRRWLRAAAVEARPPGPARLAARWCRRHPAIAGALIAGTVGFVAVSIALGEVSRERERAEEQARLFGLVNEVLVQIFDEAPGATRIDEVLDAAERPFLVEPDPDAKAFILTEFARIRLNTADFERALFLAEVARDTAEEAFGSTHERTLRAELHRAYALRELALLQPDSEPQLERVRDDLIRLRDAAAAALGPLDPIALDASCELGRVEHDLGNDDAATAALRPCYDGYCASPGFGPRSWSATAVGHMLGRRLIDAGRLAEAERLITESVEVGRASPPSRPEAYTLAFRLASLATLRKAQERLFEARDARAEAVAALRVALGDAHPETISGIRNLGLLEGRIAEDFDLPDRFPVAERHLAEAHRLALGLPRDEAMIRATLFSLGNMRLKMDKLDAALADFTELLRRVGDDASDEHWMNGHYSAGKCLAALGRTDEARHHLELAVEAARTRDHEKRLHQALDVLDDLGQSDRR